MQMTDKERMAIIETKVNAVMDELKKTASTVNSGFEKFFTLLESAVKDTTDCAFDRQDLRNTQDNHTLDLKTAKNAIYGLFAICFTGLVTFVIHYLLNKV